MRKNPPRPTHGGCHEETRRAGNSDASCKLSFERRSGCRRRKAQGHLGKRYSAFQEYRNHCHAFRDLAAFAAGKANVALQLVEDLKFVLIGKGILDRGSGPYYIRNTPGARGGSGFQESLRDGSPQVEHAMAAIYLGRGEVPGRHGFRARCFH